MKHKSLKVNGLLLCAVLFGVQLHAQFLNFIPEFNNYFRGDVQVVPDGLLFRYTYQDSTLAIHTKLLQTDNDGRIQWMKNAEAGLGSYALLPDSSVIVSAGKSLANGTRYMLIQKMDAAGNIVWTKSVKVSGDGYVTSIIPASKDLTYIVVSSSSFLGSTYYSKSSVVALDGAGQKLWTRSFGNATFTTDYSFARSMLAANGDFIGVADIRGSMYGAANGMMVTRITQAGDIVFSRYIDFRETHTQLSVTGLVETSAGNIVFGGRLMTDQISTYPNAMWIARMDDTGNLLQQKVYSGGVDVGELLHSLRYAGGKIYAYMHFVAPFDSVNRAVWIGELDEQSLSFTAHHATEMVVSTEDPYGNVPNSFCISSEGKPTVAGGFYCQERNKYYPVMLQLSSALAGSCPDLEVALPLTDSVVAYPVTNYVPQGSITVTIAADTAVIRSTDEVPMEPGDLCQGCGSKVPPPTTAVSNHQNEDRLLIYPNPGSGLFYIDFHQPGPPVQVTVYNNLGAAVHQTVLSAMHNPIDMSVHSAGIYYVRVNLRDGEGLFYKLVISK